LIYLIIGSCTPGILKLNPSIFGTPSCRCVSCDDFSFLRASTDINSTKPYVAACITALLSTKSISDLAGRSIGLRELAPTGADIQAALSKLHGSPAKTAHAANEDSVENIKNQHPFSLMDLVKLKWSRGEHSVGNDMFELQGYEKATLEDLIVGKQLGVYRDVPLPYNLDHYFS
jgi:hypothetical protein